MHTVLWGFHMSVVTCRRRVQHTDHLAKIPTMLMQTNFPIPIPAGSTLFPKKSKSEALGGASPNEGDEVWALVRLHPQVGGVDSFGQEVTPRNVLGTGHTYECQLIGDVFMEYHEEMAQTNEYRIALNTVLQLKICHSYHFLLTLVRRVNGKSNSTAWNIFSSIFICLKSTKKHEKQNLEQTLKNHNQYQIRSVIFV